MTLSGIGDPNRGDKYTVSGFGQSGRDVARMDLNKPVNEAPFWADCLFGFTVAGLTFYMLFITWDLMKLAFLRLLGA